MELYGNMAARLLLLVLILTSIALFSLRFSRVAIRIARARTEPGYKVGNLPGRIWNFLFEVLLQGKVIRERPLPGIAHAFVFWSFLAFTAVTIRHLLTGFGLHVLDRESTVGAVYYWLAYAFAAACAVSIAGLAYRRFIVRPRVMEPLSYESGWIALLIFLLMATYMATAFIPDASAAGQWLWWSHTLVLLAFLPLIPHTKHLHLILSPWAILFKRDGFSAIPPLEGDEDFGIVNGPGIMRVTALQAYSCVECGRCTEHCPANNTGKELNPKLIALGIRDYLNQYGNASETPMVEATISQTAIFQCTTCGACEYQCPVGIQHLPMIVGLRRGAVNTGTWEDEQGTRLFLNLERNGNALGLPAAERDKFIARAQLPIFDGSQDYCLWLGCMGAYDAKGREIITAFAQVMTHLGTSFGVLKKERCTGDPARRLGNDLVFAQLAETNLETLKECGVRRVISICPHCVRTIAEDWREHGATVEIEHHSEFLARHASALPPRTEDAGTVAYHDPCYLGRYRGSYDPPRTTIRQYGELIDPPRSREHGFCCGAGGGLVFLGEEAGERVGGNRARELKETGAKRIGAACPFCATMLRDAIGPDGPPLVDIAQLAAEQLAAQPAPQA